MSGAFLAVSLSAQATTLGIPTPVGSYAFWDTFTNTGSYPNVSFTNALPGSSEDSAFSATLSASMQGLVSGAGDRIYNGVMADSAAFNLTLNATAAISMSSITLIVKATDPDLSTGLTYTDFFTVSLDGVTPTTVTLLGTTAEDVGGHIPGIIQYTWTGLNIVASQNFAISITSPASGHVSVDGLMLSQGVIPEPTALGLATLGLGVLLMRRRR